MSSSIIDSLPSLLVFGPQTDLTLDQDIEGLRQELKNSPRLSSLKEAVDELPRLWQRLVAFDDNLSQVPGEEYLGLLKGWVNNGGPLPHPTSTPPNHFALAVTVILQIAQYSRYIDTLGSDTHRKVVESVKEAGIQGFCVGFLSAVAVAVSASEDELGPSAAVALRLAVCIGAYVDKDGAYSPDATTYTAIAIRWSKASNEGRFQVEKLVQSIPHVSQS